MASKDMASKDMASKGMASKGEVTEDFRKQLLGYGLTTAEILYRRPDRKWLLQSYVWQDYDLFPKFPALHDFLAFWQRSLDATRAVPLRIAILPCQRAR